MNTKNKTSETATAILSELEKIIRLFSFYPEGHAYLNVVSNRIFNTIKQQFGALKIVMYTLDRRHFYTSDSIMEGFDKLSSFLFYKRIKTLIIHDSIKPEELIIFAKVLSRGDLILPREKSIKQILFANNVTGIEIEEVDYETIMEELEKETEQQTEITEEAVNLENLVQNLTDDEQEATRLITLIEKENHPHRYRELSDNLVVIIGRLIETERYEIPLVAVRIYAQHAYRRDKERTITAIAKKQVEIISREKGMIEQIVVPIVTGNPYYYESTIKMIKLVGEPALQELTGKMIKTEALQSLKFIARALIIFRKQAYPYLEKVILSQNYKASIIAIDTAMNIKTGVESTIASGLKHPDIRIKKKSLQSLFELNTAGSSDIIEKLLVENNSARLLSLTINMIGRYKRTMFIPVIRHIIFNSSIPYSVKQDALLTLGELGGKEATNVIIASVFAPSAPLPKQYPDIKLISVKILGSSLNEIAIANLVTLLENKDGRLRDAVWNTLYEIGKKINV